MFRKMRRFKQQLSDAETERILLEGKTGILGVLGDDGYPYTVPVNYVYQDGKIYLHGPKSGHKFDAIQAYEKVSFCVVEKDDVLPEKLTTAYRSVIAFGRARILESDAEKYNAANILSLKYAGDPQQIDTAIRRLWNALCCMEITIEHMTGKASMDLLNARASE